MAARRSAGARSNSSARAAPGLGGDGDVAPSLERRLRHAVASGVVVGRAFRVADESLGARQEPRRADVEGVRHVVARDLRLPRPVARGIRIEPVAVLERLGGQHDAVTGAPAQMLDPAAHAVELPHQDLVRPVGLVHRQRDDGRGIRPARATHVLGRDAAHEHVDRADDVGHHRRDTAFVGLVDLEVAQPRRPERLRVHQRRGSGAERLRVAGPAEPLVALRAVGGHRDEVVALRPEDVRVELVERFVRRAERAAGRQVARDRDRARPRRPRRRRRRRIGSRGT